MKKRKQENIDGVEHVFYEDLTKQVKELKYTIDKNEALFAKQLRPRPKLFQRILQWVLNAFGTVYVLIERFVEYPDDDIILGMKIDEDIQKMSRKKLCRYMDAVLPQRGFFDIQSTSKIRLGCQLLREHKRLKKIAKEHAIASFSGWSFEQPAEEQVKNDNYKVDIDKLKNEIKDISNEDTKK